VTGECWNTHPVVLRTQPVKKGRSNQTIVRSAIDVKTWLARVPSVEGKCSREHVWSQELRSGTVAGDGAAANATPRAARTAG